MSDTCHKSPGEQGSVTVIALIILVVLTLLGLLATRTSTTDIQIARNQIPYKTNFYAAEGGLNREAAEVGRGQYPVTDINTTGELVNQGSTGLPSPAHEVGGIAYDFGVDYLGYSPPPAGYSVIHFNRYDYFIDAKANTVTNKARYYKIGPKAE